ncbi:MAG: S8 family serine peptidase, partial [Actinobacteria bacterium]|nr:S8 family serine peptidase [Actinomycetota bacterium]
MSGRSRRLSGAGASAAGLLLALACAGAEAAPARWTSAEPAPAEHRSSASPRDRTVASAPLPTRKPRARPVAEFVPGEVVVRFRDGGGASTVSRVAERLKLRHRRSLPALGASVLGLGRGQTVAGGIAVLERQPEVLYAEPNYLYQLQATPNDPGFPSLWGMNQPSDADIDAPEAWDLHTGTSSTTVAVMDTGMAYDHPDLAPNVWSNPGETGGGKETNGVDDDGNGFVDDHRGWNFYALYEYQEVAIVGAPTGGTFTLTFDGETTAALPYNATAAAVESALIALPGVGPTDVAAFDGPLPGTPVVVGFQQANQPQMTATASLTGGASPAVVVTTLQDGASPDNDPRDYEGHGSHVAGTIGAQGDNSTNVAGVNWDVSLINLRVCGEAGCPLDAIASAMAYAGEIVGGAPRARVANGSFGGPGFSQLMLDAINGAPETLFVFAAGNSTLDNDTDPDAFYPCSYSDGTTSTTSTENNILCVAASTQTDGIAEFSNYGATTVDLGAPGVGTLSTVPDVDTVWSDDLETDGTWTTGGTNNTWARTTEVVSPPSGTHVLTDSPGGNYESSTNSFAQRTSTFDLTGRRSCAVEYSINLALGAGDLLHEEWTTDGVTWNSVPLGAWAGPGSTGGFVAVSEPLGVGDAANVNFRWRLETNVGTPANGVWLDDLQVACVATTYDGDETDVFSGTSMASPHVAGAAGLLFSYSTTLSPALASPLTPSQMKTIIIESVDPVAAFATKTVSGGRLNLHNMLAGGFCASDGVSLPATHIGTAGADVLTGTAGADVITGLAGNDQIDGGDGDDAICGGLGNDQLTGKAGNDTLDG